jgi:hypothetical protein
MKLSLISRIVFASCISGLAVRAQGWISVGVKGGVPLTDPFADRTFTSALTSSPNPFGPGPFTESISTRTYSGSRNFVLGPTLEVQLPFGLGVEADALYRPMNVRVAQTTSLPGIVIGGPTLESRIDTWEFPVLAKYRMPLPVVKPYIEGGPAFRANSASLARHMSGTGVSAGIGVEARIGHLRVSPEVRYTHWGSDSTYSTPYHAVSYPNELEFLAGVATAPGGSGLVSQVASGWSKYVSVGVKGGLPFTTAFVSDEYAKVTYPPISCGNFSSVACTTADPTVQTYGAPRNYLVGPMVEVHLPLHLSVEANALYAPVSLAAPSIPGLGGFLIASTPSIQTFDYWQFPVLGKYRFSAPFVTPYLEAGPTFRRTSSPIGHYLATAGATAGVGVEAIAWRVHVAPEVRFVHWGNDGADTPQFYASRRNQAQFLVGLSY